MEKTGVLGSSATARRGSIGRIATYTLPVALALLLALPGPVAAGSTHSWSAPFHGRFSKSGSESTGHCLAAANDTSRAAPTFNSTTGLVHMSLEANATGASCGATPTYGKVLSTFTFTTFNFSVSAGLHHVTVTWSLRWFADLTVIGGTSGHSYPASASYRIGVNGDRLCDMANGSCTIFPNSSARGHPGGHGWTENFTATGSNYSRILSATVTLYLNTTFTANTKYQISTSIFGQVASRARLSGHSSRAYLLMIPVLGGSARLVSIAVA